MVEIAKTRKTFRSVTNDVAWQRQLRDKFNSEGAPPIDLDLKKAIVRPVSRRIAEAIILKYEWLGTMATGSKYHFGIFFGSYCAGVTCAGPFGTAGTPHTLWRLDDPADYIVLSRGACVHWAPSGTNSKLVSWTVKLLRKMRVGKILAAYADTDAGEIGTIYQACGWYYVGKGSATRQWIAPNGRIYDQMQPQNFARSRGGTRMQWTLAMRAKGWKEQKTNAKHRYVQILDTSDARLLARVKELQQPYPKRASAGEA